MDKLFTRSDSVKREIQAISSKSEAHRYLICAALGDRDCEIICTDTNADIDATVGCLNALGADVKRTEKGFVIERGGREPVVYEGEINDLKILRDGYVVEVYVNGGKEVYTALL